MPPIPISGQGVVYFIRLSDGRTKIGVTSDWDKRKKSHIVNGLVIDDEMLLYVSQGRSMERYYHDKFSDKRIEREFFNLNNDDWLAVVDEVVFLVDMWNESCVKGIVLPIWMNDKVLSCGDCGMIFVESKLGAPDLGCLFCGSALGRVNPFDVTGTKEEFLESMSW
jgi:hypothetical protein